MKFLIMLDDTTMQPSNAFVQMEAQQRWVEANRKKKVIDAIYSLAGNHGSVVVVEVDNHEALDEIMIDMPYACGGTDIRIYPLADYGVAMKRLATQAKRVLGKMKPE